MVGMHILQKPLGCTVGTQVGQASTQARCNGFRTSVNICGITAPQCHRSSSLCQLIKGRPLIHGHEESRGRLVRANVSAPTAPPPVSHQSLSGSSVGVL